MEILRKLRSSLTLGLSLFLVSVAGCDGNPGKITPPAGNTPPFIDSIVESARAVTVGGTVNLTVSAHGPDTGSTLTYAWTATAGSFAASSVASTVWTAPGTAGSHTLTITVTDDQGATAQSSLTIDVVQALPPPPAGTCSGSFAASVDQVSGVYACSATYSGLTDAAVVATRTLFGFNGGGNVNGGDAVLPSFAFKGVPTTRTYALTELVSFEAAAWWTKVPVTDLYMYVASKNAMTTEVEWGSGAVSVTSVSLLTDGTYEIHGTVSAVLEPHAGSLSSSSRQPNCKDPLAKLPSDATGTVLLQGTF